ncbi:MAG: HD domain-containing protein, partial [Firmicutes bacterium]|nr:HD domain-containing protein [Bacillota bacterium]
LGTAYMTYPGAEHTRFSHSLGVYEVIRQILSSFERNHYQWPHELNLLAMVSGLLHDIGHAAFSHALEQVLGVRHEVWTTRIILDQHTEVHQILEQVRPGFAADVAHVIDKSYAHPLIVQLVSGQLDADRLDYLMRDSLFSGVNYGNFDLARIIRVMMPWDNRLVVKMSGMHTVESYLLARYFMYWQVYFHPVSRSAEVILRAALQRAHTLVVQGYRLDLPHPALQGLLQGDISLTDYMALDDMVIFTALNLWQSADDAVLSDLSRRFLNRRLFQYCEDMPDSPEKLDAVRRCVRHAGYDPDYYCIVDTPSTVYYDYYSGVNASQRTGDGIYLWDDARHTLTEMSHSSRTIHAMATEQKPLKRLYVPEEVRVKCPACWESQQNFV